MAPYNLSLCLLFIISLFANSFLLFPFLTLSLLIKQWRLIIVWKINFQANEIEIGYFAGVAKGKIWHG